jgi:ABC-type branched-subunit amino acid transport system permease subunit
MYYYWIPIAALFLIALFTDTNTWSPFQSDQVREICAHMTKAERRSALKRGASWGILVGVVPGMVGLILGVLVFESATVGVTICSLAFLLIVVVLYKKWSPGLVKSQQNFLASTEWAKGQGVRPDDIRLYKWGN